MSTQKISKKDSFIAQLMAQPMVDLDSEQQAIREQALKAVQQLDFPTSRTEAWKYTRVASILNTKHEAVSTSSTAVAYNIEGLDAYQLVFINGVFQEELSKTEELDRIKIRTLAQARFEDPEVIASHFAKHADFNSEIFTALNTAFNFNGAYIRVEKNTVLEKPLHVVNITSGEHSSTMPRNLIIAEEGAQLQVIHSYLEEGHADSFINSVTEVVVKENARADYYVLQNAGDNHKHVHSIDVYQHANSRFNTGAYTFGGKLVRNNLNIKVDGPGCETNLDGTYVLTGKQHVDNHTVVDHLKPNCQSNENYKGVMDGNSTGVFNGKVFVRQDAQQILAYQNNQNVLLSDTANINSKPELEIYADDVKCSHGSTTGQLDEEALFYMKARGIQPDRAKRLLIQAFIADVIENVDNEALVEHLLMLLDQKLSQ